MRTLSLSNSLGETPFECVLRSGELLRGIVHVPKRPRGIGVIMLPAGYKYRAGPHTYYVKLGRLLSEEGYHVLRADFKGLGYSDGDLPHGPLYKNLRKIEDGFYTDDVVALATGFQQQFGLGKLALGGICGGAVMAQVAAERLPGIVTGAIEINTAVTRMEPPGKKSQKTREAVKRSRLDYLSKLFSGWAWRRLLFGKSDYKAILSTISRADSGAPEQAEPEPINPQFQQSWDAAKAHNCQLLLIFGGKDSRWYEFKDYILDAELAGAMEGKSYQIKVIEEANHELHLRPWQQESFDIICEFMARI